MSKPDKGNGAGARFRHFLKKIFWPVTPLTVITVASAIVTIWAWVLYFITRPSEPLVVAITTAISFIVATFYLVDRLLTSILSYKKLAFGEVVLGVVIIFFYSYQNRKVVINFHTDKDFIVVLFDSNGNSLSDFHRRGIFSKELNVYQTHVLHLDSSLASIHNLRIREPEHWDAFSQHKGRLEIDGQSIRYILRSDNSTNPYLHRNPQPYIDSLLHRVTDER